MNRALLFLLSILLGLSSCHTSEKIVNKKPVEQLTIVKPKKRKSKNKPSFETKLTKKLSESAAFANHFTGLVIYDHKLQLALFDYNGNRYFTPASNSKLFTFYTCLRVLDKTIPFFSYIDRPEGLYIKANANPSFLHPHLENTAESFHFLKKFEKDIIIDLGVFEDEPLGDGWAWDDAIASYQCEKSSFPIYGNTMCVIHHADSLAFYVEPKLLQKAITPTSENLKYPKRDKFSNAILLSDSVIMDKHLEIDIPIKFDPSLFLTLLSDTLNRKVRYGKLQQAYTDVGQTQLAPLYEKMLKQSDNMISEQLLLHASHVLFDTMGSRRIINYAMDSIFIDLKQKPRWVDGSGLSRYNLATPHSIIFVLEKIRRRLPEAQLTSYFPNIELVDATGMPIWLYAKSGSLSNNYNLSGYMECKSGRRVTFSFMNNHYRHPRKQMLKEMDEVLISIYENY